VAVVRPAGPSPAARAAVGTPQRPFTRAFFGMSTSADFTQLSDADLVNEINPMKSIGVYWLRVTVPWGRVQHVRDFPEKWDLIDRLMSAAAARGMLVDAIVENPPTWAEQSVPHVACKVQPPFDVTSYGTFAAELAARYPATVLAAIELENSPNLPGVWRKPDPCAYAALMKASYGRIKQANGNVQVLTGGLGGTRNDGTSIPGNVFFADLYAYGAKGNFDVVSYHPYSYPCLPSQKCGKDRPWYRIPDVRSTMVSHGDSAKQIWATEFGSPTNGTGNDVHVDEGTQSKIMLDGMIQWHKYPWSGPFFVFTFRDSGTDPRKKSDWFGLVSHSLAHKKIAFSTYRYEATSQGPPPS
jgi:polysaccharide biosynthesis protein PslG